MPVAGLSLLAASFSGAPASVAAGTASISGHVQVQAGLSANMIIIDAYQNDAYVDGTRIWSGSGDYTIDGLAPGSYKLVFYAYKDGGTPVTVQEWYDDKELASAAQSVTLGAGQAQTNISAVLNTGATVSGKVNVPAGVDATKITVDATRDGEYSSYTQSLKADGTYTLTNVIAGKYRLRFGWGNPWEPNSTPSQIIESYLGGKDWSAATLVDVPRQGNISGQNITLAPAGIVSGRVTVPAGVDATKIYAYFANTADPQRGGGYATPNANGEYIVGGLVPSSYKVSFNWGGDDSPILPAYYGPQGATEETATVVNVPALQPVTGVNQTLIAAAKIKGKVTVPAGFSPSNILVMAKGASDLSWMGSAQTDSTGAFSIGGLPAGSYKLQFSANSQNLVSQWLGQKADAAASAPVSVATGQTQTVANEALVAGAVVSGTISVPAGSNSQANFATLVGPSGIVSQASVANNGSFSFDRLPAGSYSIEFNRSSGLTTDVEASFYKDKSESAGASSATKVTVAAGENKSGLTSTAKTGGTLTGKVVGTDGQPLNNVPVRVYTKDGSLVTRGANSIADGTFKVTGLTTGNYLVSANMIPTRPSGSLGTIFSGNVKTEGAASTVAATVGANTDIGTLSFATAGNTGTGFADVPSGAQFSTEIAWMATAGISTGWTEADGSKTFRPLSPVNRDAMAAFMYRLAGKPAFTPPATSPFSDVPTTSQFYKEITWLANKGVSTGWTEADGSKTYRPLQAVNRDAMAAFMYRLAGKPAFTPPATSPFSDVPTTSQFYKEITWLAAQGISTGWTEADSSKTFRPLNPVNRDAMAAFMYRYNAKFNAG
ncbi:carboxypeptidase regulatory-like domain-containing protein [Paenarthrobacter nicotinovorans]|uniref:carboxypeptidase regulatory-like domain-containing protein n=1 Tax=Paenarthrobacter nicotinovorans TaxID=29320 RepID=UPI0038091E13